MTSKKMKTLGLLRPFCNDGPFPNLGLREVAALHSAPFVIARVCETCDDKNEKCYKKMLPMSVTDDEIEQFYRNACLGRIIFDDDGYTSVEYNWVCFDENRVETLYSAQLRSFYVFDTSRPERLPPHISPQYLREHAKGWRCTVLSPDINRRLLAPAILNHHKMVEAIYKPLQAFPDDFESADPRVWLAVEKLRIAEPWKHYQTKKSFDALIEASELVQEAIIEHVNTKHAAEALQHFEETRLASKKNEENENVDASSAASSSSRKKRKISTSPIK